MAKASVVGTVKTRLVPPLTHREAAELKTCGLVDIIANITTTAERAPIQGHAELIGSLGLSAGAIVLPCAACPVMMPLLLIRRTGSLPCREPQLPRTGLRAEMAPRDFGSRRG
jgi:hypothetical protein